MKWTVLVGVVAGLGGMAGGYMLANTSRALPEPRKVPGRVWWVGKRSELGEQSVVVNTTAKTFLVAIGVATLFVDNRWGPPTVAIDHGGQWTSPESF